MSAAEELSKEESTFLELAVGVGRKPPGNCSTWLPGMQLTYLGVNGVT